MLMTGLAAASLLMASSLPALTADRPRLYQDEAHGETPPPPESFRAYVDGSHNGLTQKLGFEVVAGKVRITEDALKGSRLLYLRMPAHAFTADETAAIIGFVRQGGSMFLVFDEERRQSLAATKVNDIIEPFGMRLTADTDYLHNCGGLAKAGEINQADRELPYSGGRAVVGGTPFAWQLDRAGKPTQPFAAYRKLDTGARIIVMAEGMASLFIGTKDGVRLAGVPNDPSRTTYWGKDSAIFMEEVLTWLME